jgi:hypothetical protein
MTAESGADVHHSAPRCLLGLFDAVAGGLVDRPEFDAEAEGWGNSRSLPPSIACCIRKQATPCGGGGVGAAEPWPHRFSWTATRQEGSC